MTTTETQERTTELASFLENCAARLEHDGWVLHARRLREEAATLAALTPEVVAALVHYASLGLLSESLHVAGDLLDLEQRRNAEAGLRALAALARRPGGEGTGHA